jgi:hypothetical protein
MGDTAMSDGTISDDEEFEIRKAAMSIFSRCVFYLDPNSRLTTLSPADEAKSDFADASNHELAQNLTDCGGTVLTGTGALPVVRLRGVHAAALACVCREPATAVFFALALCSRRRGCRWHRSGRLCIACGACDRYPCVVCGRCACTVCILHGPSRWLL